MLGEIMTTAESTFYSLGWKLMPQFLEY